MQYQKLTRDYQLRKHLSKNKTVICLNKSLQRFVVPDDAQKVDLLFPHIVNTYKLFERGPHNYCQITTRAHAVTCKYRIARGFFKSRTNIGMHPGLKKFSW